MPRDPELQAFSDAMRALDEKCRSRAGANVFGGLFKQTQPAFEMPAFNRQRQMLVHRATVIAAREQRNGRPECDHLLKVRFPVSDAGVEHRAQKRIAAHLVVEARTRRSIRASSMPVRSMMSLAISLRLPISPSLYVLPHWTMVE